MFSLEDLSIDVACLLAIEKFNTVLNLCASHISLYPNESNY